MNWWKNRQEIKDSETDTYKAKIYMREEIEKRGFDIDLCGYPTIEEVILSPEETIMQYKEERTALNKKIDEQLQEIEKLLGVKLC